MHYRCYLLNAHNQLLSSSVRNPFRKVGHISNLSINYYTPKVFGFFISERGIMYVMYDISIQASGRFHLHPHKINCTLHTQVLNRVDVLKGLVAAEKGKCVMIKLYRGK